jgi:predicted DCC family thiol-disulfide oxidoreductase YuxK
MAGESVILFDGVCNLCNAWVQFVIRHDPDARFAFAPLQSAAAEDLLRARHGSRALGSETIMLVEKDGIYDQSTAALRIARGLSGLWPLLGMFLMVPKVLRDAVYRGIARNRYRWFGRREVCMVPTPALRSRFL